MSNTVFIVKKVLLKKLDNDLSISDEIDINATYEEMAITHRLKYTNHTIAYNEEYIIISFEFKKLKDSDGMGKRITSGKMNQKHGYE